MLSVLLNREHTQIISFFFMGTGIVATSFMEYPLLGVSFIGLAVWVMVMSESFLLSKVQVEMQSSLESLNRKREREIEEVIHFLKQSSIAASPYESIEGAKMLCQRSQCPSMVLSTNYQIIKANKEMHELLNWSEGKLAGVPAYTINDPLVMSKVGEYASKSDNVDKKSISTHYVYIDKSGKKIQGIMNAVKIGIEGYFVTFFPLHDLILTSKQVQQMAVKND